MSRKLLLPPQTPTTVEYEPAEHGLTAPLEQKPWVLEVPQGRHCEMLVPPRLLLSVPSGHAVQDVELPAENLPAGHKGHLYF